MNRPASVWKSRFARNSTTSFRPELAAQVDVGSRVQVPFGPRKVVRLRDPRWQKNPPTRNSSPFSRSSARRRWSRPACSSSRGGCGTTAALRSGAPKACCPRRCAGRNPAGRERLFVRALPVGGEFPRLPKRQQEVWNIIEGAA